MRLTVAGDNGLVSTNQELGMNSTIFRKIPTERSRHLTKLYLALGVPN